MIKRRVIGVVSGILFLLVLWGITLTRAQTQEQQWYGPQRLSGPGVEIAGEAVMVADPYGLLHVFWSEVSPDDGFASLQYAVFDGEVWSNSIDLRVTSSANGIGSYAADVDNNGLLHLAWTEGNAGPVYYATARSNNSLSVHLWSEPIRIDVPAYQVKLQVDRGIVHVLFTNFWDEEPGVFYMRSKDGGNSWSSPYWLDPDIPLVDAPTIPQFLSDGAGGLHATWYYLGVGTDNAIGNWVRYAHSLDNGESWSDPVTIDIADEEPDELRLPHPGLAVTGEQVHVVWAGTSGTLREHRYSLDRGITWTETQRVMGHLHGQGLGGGMVTDAAGRIHFFAQIRWPQGVYHAIWDRDHWTEPSLIYLIARSDAEGRNGRYHAHSVRAGIRAGNQIVVTFTDESTGPLYMMYSTLEDVVPLPPLPTPTPTPNENNTIPSITATATPFPITSSSGPPLVNDPQGVPNFGGPVWLGVLPVVVLLFLVILLRLIQQKIL